MANYSIFTPAELSEMLKEESTAHSTDLLHASFAKIEDSLLSLACRLHLEDCTEITTLPSFSKKELGGKHYKAVVSEINEVLDFLEAEMHLVPYKGKYVLKYVPCEHKYDFPADFSNSKCEYIKSFKKSAYWFVTFNDLELIVNRDRLHQKLSDVANDDLVITMVLQRKSDCIKIGKYSKVGKAFKTHLDSLKSELEKKGWEVTESPLTFKITPKK